jgi:hypothetical protein
MQVMDDSGHVQRRMMTTDSSIPLKFAIDYTYLGEIIDKDPQGKNSFPTEIPDFSIGQ